MAVFRRLQPGVTLASARSDLARLTESFYSDFPDS